ncbi:hypothetical protein EX895_004017 [Sporisorium graminicola]|uniref:Uncharacterized protein n=1 Tax=Sporisorium graminicola TaxID=280036 RepID=A0A4U7KSC0_9BASI|nr:hypothetical protein EX895_004017 [Sporisorium graminicola]TKY87340.1 hypothetical protein EX895_004017 [Sporisorium graminicola]
MSTAIYASSSQWSNSIPLEAQDNLWRGPQASSSTLTIKPASAAVRRIRRKPVPIIPSDLLHSHSSSSSAVANLATSTSVPESNSPNSAAYADITPTQESGPSVPSAQRPQRQYLLDIDAPCSSQGASNNADDSVKQLLRSATISASSSSSRPKKGPLKWMHDKEEHSTTSSSLAVSPRQPTLSRKTSISAHLKLSLRRNKSDEPPCSELSISGPTNFVHVSTGTEGAHAAVKSPSLRRSSTVSARSSPRSSASSALSGMFETADSKWVQQDDDKPLYTASGATQPLRPLKSIRRPSKLSLNKPEPLLDIAPGPTSPKDKRKAIYAAPGSVPVILEPVDAAARTEATSSKLSPIVSPITSEAGEHFAASLGRTIVRARVHSSDGGELSPEPELSRSPSSGYESSACTSNRSSLGSLHEFSSFLEFPDLLPLSRRSSDKGRVEDDIWSGSALVVPLASNRS